MSPDPILCRRWASDYLSRSHERSLVHASGRLQDQRHIALDNPDNPLLQVRGNAGTHDIELGRATLEALTTATEHHSEVSHTCAASTNTLR